MIGINEKPLLLKRLISDGFDMMCIFLIFMLFSFILLKTPMADKHNNYQEKCLIIEKEVLNQADNDLNLASELLSSNQEYKELVFTRNLYAYLIKVLAIFIAEIIILLFIPLFNKNLTIGKSLTGILLFNESSQILVNKLQILFRFIFIFIETIILYLWTGIYTFLLMFILRLIAVLLNNKNKSICDYISMVMYIEKLSYKSII